ncbi:MAG TPA: hypothetical protein VF111_07015, partial [Thermoanaerobaculia bacterium]
MAEARPFLPGDELHQIGLDLLRIGFAREPEPPGDAGHVRVDDDAHRRLEGIRQHHVGRLATDARQRHQVLDPGRDLAVEAFDQRLRHPD